MTEFERAKLRYQKNQERKARLGIYYGPPLPKTLTLPKKEIPALEQEIPKETKKISPHGIFTVQVRCGEVDEVLTFTVQNLAGNIPGTQLSRQGFEARLKTLFSQMGRLI